MGSEMCIRDSKCTIVCAFPRASAGPPGKQPKGGFCALGADCRYLHKYVQTAHPMYRENLLIIYALTFNPTLGYPGEGPVVIASYNINGAAHAAPWGRCSPKQGKRE